MPVTLSSTSSWQPLSSRLDWCEKNYEVTPLVAEFWNTSSSISFLMVALAGFVLYNSHSLHVDRDLNLIWSSFFCVGATSVYFHWNLSLAGQLLDEISILWILLSVFGVFFPTHLMNLPVIRGDRRRLKRLLVIVGAVGTALAFVAPELNAIVMMPVALPLYHIVRIQQEMAPSAKAQNVFRVAVFIYTVSMVSWISDKFFCAALPDWLAQLQLHAVWHVGISGASFVAVTVLMRAFLIIHYPHLQPSIRLQAGIFPVCFITPDEESGLAGAHSDVRLTPAKVHPM